MKRIVLVLLALCFTLPLFGQASTFQRECSNIGFSYGDGSQALITAWCLKSDQVAKQTSLQINGVSNVDGYLTDTSGQSNFQRSCGMITIVTDQNNAKISALCRTKNGNWRSSTLILRGIRNNNGNLSY